MKYELPRAAATANYDLAQFAINTIANKARADGWDSPHHSQVGFDFEQWVNNISQPEITEAGRIGILNVERMGTAEDFEKIAQAPNSAIRGEMLWHTGRRMGDSFRRLVYENSSERTDLAEARQAVWGDKTPQWWLLNYGNFYAGAYPMQSGTYSIETGAYQIMDDARDIVSRHVNAYLRDKGLLV